MTNIEFVPEPIYLHHLSPGELEQAIDKGLRLNPGEGVMYILDTPREISQVELVVLRKPTEGFGVIRFETSELLEETGLSIDTMGLGLGGEKRAMAQLNHGFARHIIKAYFDIEDQQSTRETLWKEKEVRFNL